MLNHHLVISNLGNNEEIMKMIDTLSLVPPSHLHTTRAAEIFICLIPSFCFQSNKMLTSQISKFNKKHLVLCQLLRHWRFWLMQDFFFAWVEIHLYNHSYTHSLTLSNYKTAFVWYVLGWSSKVLYGLL